VCPIPKCPSPSEISDFRPISRLPSLAKVLEKILCKKYIVPYVADKVDDSQFAYIPGSGKGAVTALTSMQLHILRHLDSCSGGVRIAAVDLSKAFDRINHSTVVKACLKFCLPKEIILWIISYLSDRRQCVSVDGSSSTYIPVTSGVPQGSIIGPILFSLVMDSFTSVCNNSLVFKYADDITILHFLRNDSDDGLQSEFDNIHSWSVSNNLTINQSKSFVMDVITILRSPYLAIQFTCLVLPLVVFLS
jgi:retron-type reverse transcriptase